jgi:hypothetical protein
MGTVQSSEGFLGAIVEKSADKIEIGGSVHLATIFTLLSGSIHAKGSTNLFACHSHSVVEPG